MAALVVHASKDRESTRILTAIAVAKLGYHLRLVGRCTSLMRKVAFSSRAVRPACKARF
jgi:hypothetical protein